MKIIKSPKAEKLNKIADSVQDKKITCFCGCEFEWDVKDIKEEKIILNGVDEDKHIVWYFVECPECGNEYRITEDTTEWVVIHNESTSDKVSK